LQFVIRPVGLDAELDAGVEVREPRLVHVHSAGLVTGDDGLSGGLPADLDADAVALGSRAAQVRVVQEGVGHQHLDERGAAGDAGPADLRTGQPT
jgi:hypothetical protein